MKVLIINSVCGIRSTGRICSDIADILISNGDDCKICYGREDIPSKYVKHSYKIGNNYDVYFHALISRVFDNVGYCSKRATKKFIKWIDEYNPDIIHLHNLHGYYINLKILFNYLKKIKKPIVWTLHDCWSFTGHCAHFDLIGCNKWKNGGCNSCPQKRRYPKSILIDRSKKNYFEKREYFNGIDNMMIVTPSKWLSDLVKNSYLKEYPVKTIYNGIDLNAFKPKTLNEFKKRYNLEDKIVYLGVATAWTEGKGINDFKLMNQMKKENEIIVLVGLTEKQIKDLPRGMIGIPKTNNISELVEIYAGADVFVNPTYEESFGLTNIEAQACGTPAVCYNAGGTSEGVPKEYVIERGNVKALFAKARHVAMQKKTEILDVTAFCKQARYNEYINLYQVLLNKY